MLGPMFAFIRPIIALLTGVIGGFFVEKIVKDEYVTTLKIDHEHSKKTLMDGLKYAFITLPQDIAWPLVKGILLAGLITLLIPDNFFINHGITGLLAMVIMALVSIPMYICATASVPIAAGLILSGNLEPGAALVFLMAGPATNIATISVITKTLGRKIVYIYLSTIFICSIIFGSMINKFMIINSDIISHHMHHGSWIHFMTGFFLLVICLYAILSKLNVSDNLDDSISKSDLYFIVKGMTCNHCKETVMDAINACDGIKDVKINLESGQTFIYGNALDKKQIFTSINNVGFSIGENS